MYHTKGFHSYGDITISRERLQNVGHLVAFYTKQVGSTTCSNPDSTSSQKGNIFVPREMLDTETKQRCCRRIAVSEIGKGEVVERLYICKAILI